MSGARGQRENGGSPEEAAALPPASDPGIEAEARRRLAALDLDGRLHQMAGERSIARAAIDVFRPYNVRPIVAGDDPAHGIPALRFADGPRGVVIPGATCFPVSMARGATWDPELERRVGDALGVETRIQGANFFAGVCINLLRHPGWGRAQETYGEDPFHVGEMGAACVEGVQRHAMACVKHFAANSIENSRFRVDVRIDERALREVYLRHFRRVVDAGVAAVMTAYNRVDGTYCGHHRRLVRELLKGEWGFTGFVISDFVFGIRDGAAALAAGVDVEMPYRWRYGRRWRRRLARGELPVELVDDAVLRILRQKLRFARVGEPARYGRDRLAGAKHRALAREVARRGMVLLRNEPVPPDGAPLVPLAAQGLRRVAVIGPLAAFGNTGDHGSSQVRPPEVVTLLAGIEAALGSRCRVVHEPGRRPAGAAAAAAGADVAIVVAGYTHRDEGENVLLRGGDRTSLRLRRADELRIAAVAEACPRTIVVLVGGSAIVTEEWRERVAAIVVAWYPGMEGGHALAEILLGEAPPTGRLPCVFPRSEADLPPFDPSARRVDYGLLHGYRWLDHHRREPAYPFGFGLSTTVVRLGAARVARPRIGPDETARIAVDVTNAGPRAGEEIVQLYAGRPGSRFARPVRELVAFARVRLAPGETRTVELELPARRLAVWDAEAAAWTVEPGEYALLVGRSSRASDGVAAALEVRG